MLLEREGVAVSHAQRGVAGRAKKLTIVTVAAGRTKALSQSPYTSLQSAALPVSRYAERE